MNVRVMFFCIFLILTTLCYSQDSDIEFPIALYPEESFTIPAGYDTLFWLLKDSQYEQARLNSLELRLLDSIVVILKKKTTLLNEKSSKLREIIGEKNEIINLNREGYIHYRDLWQETDLQLEKTEIESIRKFRRGMITGFIFGALITGSAFLLF